jgi:hypothetical protein
MADVMVATDATGAIPAMSANPSHGRRKASVKINRVKAIESRVNPANRAMATKIASLANPGNSNRANRDRRANRVSRARRAMMPSRHKTASRRQAMPSGARRPATMARQLMARPAAVDVADAAAVVAVAAKTGRNSMPPVPHSP